MPVAGSIEQAWRRMPESSQTDVIASMFRIMLQSNKIHYNIRSAPFGRKRIGMTPHMLLD